MFYREKEKQFKRGKHGLKRKRKAQMIAAILIAALALPSGSVSATETIGTIDTTQAEESTSQVSSSVADGLYTLPSYELRELESGTIDYTDSRVETQQIVCEERNGIYLLDGKELSFYSLETGETASVYTFSGNDSAYTHDDYLYVLHEETVYIYDLANQILLNCMNIESDYIGKAVGVDAWGRIYVAAGILVGVEWVYKIFLYSAEGELLSSCETGLIIYSFAGFDSSNGNYYVEGYGEMEYYGSSLSGSALMQGNVSDTGISFESTTITYLCRNTRYLHRNGAALFGDRYLVASSTAYDSFYVWDSDNSLNSVMSLSRSTIPYTVEKTTYDTTSIGVQAVYRDKNGSIITYTEDKTLVEYNMETGKEITTFTAAHYVFNILQMGDTLLIIEKEDGAYYIEIVDWSKLGGISISGDCSTLKVGEAGQLTTEADLSYSVAAEWSSSDNTVASVTSTGRVTAWSEGTATITANTTDGKYTASYQITVTASDIQEVEENAVILDGTVTQNISENNYETYGKRVRSYLMENEDGTFTRVESDTEHDTLIEKYSSDYALLSSAILETELTFFGGFYEGENYYFLVFGNDNSEEDDTKEVIRIVKYDKEWNRLDSCGICGANTYEIFEAGSARMTEANGKLYLHTCHTMYASSDGLHHQANMTFVLDEDTMEVTDGLWGIANYFVGYVSHSFNQFIQTDGEYVYRVDHGDAYPRGVCITKCSVEGTVTSVSFDEFLPLTGELGDNYTGVSVGGLELSSDNCLVVGNSVEKDFLEEKRNIFLVVIDKEFNEEHKIWLTDYTSGIPGYISEDTVEVKTPQLVKLAEDQFLIMWEEEDGGSVAVKAVTVDADGTLTSDIFTLSARLSDCQPIVTSDGLVQWYVTDGSTVTMYRLNPYDLKASANNLAAWTVENTNVSIKKLDSVSSGIKIKWNAVAGASGYYIYRKTENGKYSKIKTIKSGRKVSYTDTAVKDKTGKIFTYRVKAYYESGGKTYTSSCTEKKTARVMPVSISSLKNVSPKTMVVKWKENAEVTGYQIQYTMEKFSKSYTTDTTFGASKERRIGVIKGKTYTVRVRAFQRINGKRYYSAWSNTKSVTINK